MLDELSPLDGAMLAKLAGIKPQTLRARKARDIRLLTKHELRELAYQLRRLSEAAERLIDAKESEG